MMIEIKPDVDVHRPYLWEATWPRNEPEPTMT